MNRDYLRRKAQQRCLPISWRRLKDAEENRPWLRDDSEEHGHDKRPSLRQDGSSLLSLGSAHQRTAGRTPSAGEVLLRAEIDESKYILRLPENWDEEGSPAYKAETYNLVIRCLLTAIKGLSSTATRPSIQPGPEGSVHVFWSTTNADLHLSAVPEDSNFVAYHYEEKTGALSQGVLSLDKRENYILKGLLSRMFA